MGRAKGENSTLSDPRADLLPGRGSNLSPFQVWAWAPGRRLVGDWATMGRLRAKGERAFLGDYASYGRC